MILIHGDDLTTSRKALSKEIQNFKNSGYEEIIRFKGESLNLTDVKQALEAKSMFGTQKAIVIENLLSRRQSAEKNQILRYLKDLKEAKNILLWEDKLANNSSIKKLTKSLKISQYKLTNKRYAFLDSIRPGNQKDALAKLELALKQDSPESVFFFTSRRIFKLVSVKLGNKQSLQKLQSWQKNKLINQSKKFKAQRLLELHNLAYRIDKSIKTGKNTMPLAALLDLLILEL